MKHHGSVMVVSTQQITMITPLSLSRTSSVKINRSLPLLSYDSPLSQLGGHPQQYMAPHSPHPFHYVPQQQQQPYHIQHEQQQQNFGGSNGGGNGGLPPLPMFSFARGIAPRKRGAAGIRGLGRRLYFLLSITAHTLPFHVFTLVTIVSLYPPFPLSLSAHCAHYPFNLIPRPFLTRPHPLSR